MGEDEILDYLFCSPESSINRSISDNDDIPDETMSVDNEQLDMAEGDSVSVADSLESDLADSEDEDVECLDAEEIHYNKAKEDLDDLLGRFFLDAVCHSEWLTRYFFKNSLRV